MMKMVFKFCFFFAVAVFSTGNISAQESPSSPAERADYIIEMARELRSQDIWLAQTEQENLLNTASKEDLLFHYGALIEYAFSGEQFEDTLKYAQQLSALANELNSIDHKHIANLYTDFTNVILSGRAEDVEEFTQSLDVYKNGPTPYVRQIAYNLHGAAAAQYGQNYIAEKNYREALRQVSQRGASRYWEISINLEMAALLSRKGLINEVFTIYEDAFKLAQRTGSTIDIGEILYSTGHLLYSHGNYAESEKVNLALLERDRSLGGNENSFLGNYGLTKVYQATKEYQKSYDIARQLLLAKSASEDFLIALTQIQAINAASLGKLEEAETLQQTLYDYFASHPSFLNTYWGLRTYLVDSFIEKARGNFDRAWDLKTDYYTKIQLLEANDNVLNAMELENEYKRQYDLQQALTEQTLQTIGLEKSMQTYLLIFLGLLTILVSTALYYKNKASKSFKSEAILLNKLNKSKSIYLANMSHEIRTPLNAIIGFSESMTMGIGAKTEEERRQTLGYITKAGRNLNKLLGDVLDLSKIEAGKMDLNFEHISPRDAVEPNIPVFVKLAEKKKISISFNHQTSAKIKVDKSRLSQIISNFVSNAIKYNHEGGEITVGCKKVGKEVQLYVKDNGIGIKKSKLQDVFNIYERSDGVTFGEEGTGLGLSISKTLAETMGGSIGVISEPEKGSTFWVQFPISKK